MGEAAVRVAPWLGSVRAEVGASIYPLEPGERLAGGRAAHRSGLWVHADVILRHRAGQGFVNTGVDAADVVEILEELPTARVEVHLMVLGAEPGWEKAVDDVAALLATAPVSRWSARPAVLDRLRPLVPEGAECWMELQPGRVGRSVPDGDGVLVMLIEPGTKGTADPAAFALVSAMAAGGVPVGVDGGVTAELADAAVAAGAGHLVVGRALWDRSG